MCQQTTCVNCEKSCDGEVIKNEEGQSYCADCYDYAYAICEACDAEIDLENQRWYVPRTGRYAGSLLCMWCHDSHYGNCYKCDDIFPLEQGRESADGDFYCNECFYATYTECYSCGAEVPSDDAVWVIDGDYCSECAGSCHVTWRAGEFYIPVDNADYTEIRSRRKYGVELETSECSAYYELYADTIFGAKEDGSITGMEFVSPIFAGDAGLREIEHFCKLANSAGFEVDDHCGYHAHFDLSYSSLEEMKRIATAYKLTETVWRRFVSDARARNSNCVPIKWDCEDIAKIDTDAAWELHCRGTDRYQWCNLNAYLKHRTVEIRLHSATLNAEKVINWIKAHTRFIDSVASMSTEEVVARFSEDYNAKFAAMSDIWDDFGLTDFYLERAALFGKTLNNRSNVCATS